MSLPILLARLNAADARSLSNAELTEMAKSMSLEELEQVALASEAAALAASTRRGYAASWAVFEDFCRRRGFVVRPATVETTRLFLAERAAMGVKSSTLRQDKAAIRHFHLDAGLSDPTADRRITQLLVGHKKHLLDRGIGVSKKTPLLTDDIRQICAHLDHTNSLIGIRNKALVLCAYAGALRSEETVNRRIGDAPVTAKGIVIYLRRSKTDQEGQGQFVGIVRGEDPATCPVLAIQTWCEVMRANGIRDDSHPLFPAIHDSTVPGGTRSIIIRRKSITTAHARGLLKRACAKAGVPDANISFHSLRRGHITQALANDAQFTEALATGRWKNPAMLMEYWAKVEAQMKTSSRHLGL